MSYFQGLAPVNYYESMVPDFRSEALKETQNQVSQTQLAGLQMQNQQAKTQFDQQQQNTSLGNAAIDLQIAASQGPDALQAMLQKHSGVIGTVGVTPESAMQTFNDNPGEFFQLAGMVGLKSLGPQGYFAAQQSAQQNALKLQQQGQLAQQNLQYKYDSLGQQGRYQNAQLEQGQQRLGLEAQKNKADIENRRLDRQLSAETNDLKRRQIRQQIDQNNQKFQQSQQQSSETYQDAIGTLSTSMNTLNDIVTSPALSRITGISGSIPDIPGTSAADTRARLDTFKSQAFLSAVKSMKGMGALSDAEGKKLDQAVGSLQTSQSEAAFKHNAKTIMDMYTRKRNEAISKYIQLNGIKRITAPQVSVDYLKANPEMSTEFVKRYGYLPDFQAPPARKK